MNMQLKTIIWGFIILFFLGCKKNSKIIQDNNQVILETTIEADTIKARVDGYMKEYFVSLANGKTKPLSDLIGDIKNIKGIQKANYNSDTSLVIIKQTDGLIFNIILSAKDDPIAFDVNRISSIKGQKVQSYKYRSSQNVSTPTVSIMPPGKRVLMLLPFQKSFKQDTSLMREIFSNKGFSVEILSDEKVTLDVFRNNYLQNFDFVYVSSHGLYDVGLYNGQTATGIATGVRFDKKSFYALPDQEKQFLGIGGDRKGPYYLIISPQFLKANNSGLFKNTWIFMDACSSLKSHDLANYFIENGAAGYNGYKDPINLTLANAIATALLVEATEGNAIADATSYSSRGFGFELYKGVSTIKAKDVNASLLDYTGKGDDQQHSYYLPIFLTKFLTEANLGTGDPTGARGVFDYCFNETHKIRITIYPRNYRFITYKGFIIQDIGSMSIRHYKWKSPISLIGNYTINLNASNVPWEYDGYLNLNSPIIPNTEVFFYTIKEFEGNVLSNGSIMSLNVGKETF